MNVYPEVHDTVTSDITRKSYTITVVDRAKLQVDLYDGSATFRITFTNLSSNYTLRVAAFGAPVKGRSLMFPAAPQIPVHVVPPHQTSFTTFRGLPAWPSAPPTPDGDTQPFGLEVPTKSTLTTTCACGFTNEWAEPVEKYVCYNCRSDKAMGGFDE